MDVEEASAIRTGLRAFPDVRLVYSEADADASISLLGYENRSETNRHLGYTVAYYASRACTIGEGDNKYSLDLVLFFDMETASTLDILVHSIVANIDSKVNEKVRRWNANAQRKASPRAQPE